MKIFRRLSTTALTGIVLFASLLAPAGSAVAAEPSVRVKIEGKVRKISLERYVLGVVYYEMIPTWPLEALKAQAVASRTYAMRRMREARRAGRAWDVTDDVGHQVYDEPAAQSSGVREAVRATRAEGVCDDEGPIEAVFFSTCGGKTEDSDVLWGRTVPYLRHVQCNWCAESPNYFWIYEISEREFLKALFRVGVRGKALDGVAISGRTRSGRMVKVAVDTDRGLFELDGKDLRSAIGETRLKSLALEIDWEAGVVKFLGSGAGHAVGMCQWGARGQALEGRTHREILSSYYLGTKSCKLY